jgi:TolA-binding protein
MKRLLFFTFVLIPCVLNAQTKDELRSIQRDVAQLEEEVRALQKSQDEKFTAILSQLQQAVDASTKLTAAMAVFQREVDTKMTDQQTKLVAPVATLGTKVDSMSDDFRTVGTTVADLVHKMGALDNKLTDIKNAIAILNAPPATPPPAPQAAGPAVPACPSSAESSWESARRDNSGGHFELALKEYADYVKCFGDTANAPEAQYQIGYIYFTNMQYDDAAQAYDVVIERWPENKKTQDALYFKGVCLMKSDHKTEAGKVFKEFLAKYPHNPDHVTQAHANLRALGYEPKKR